ncbi:MAG: response regulator [Thermodesulfobacteriota bacterium]|nr:response regulator [Thermodesulfobacteriota bacterium]
MENKTILVIEDDAMNMKLVRALLTIGGYHILEAVDAEAGIRLAEENRPDLILVDIQLPGMDGLTATRIIRKTTALQDIAVVALSSYAMQGDEKKAEEAGCAGYITKPINTREFIETITHYLCLGERDVR